MARVFFVLESEEPPVRGRFSRSDAALRNRQLAPAARALAPHRSSLARARHWRGASHQALAVAEELRQLLQLQDCAIHVSPCLSQHARDVDWRDFSTLLQGDWSAAHVDQASSYNNGTRTEALNAWSANIQEDALVFGDQWAARYLMRRLANWSLPAIFRHKIEPHVPVIISAQGVVSAAGGPWAVHA
jgi:hypothetical protein